MCDEDFFHIFYTKYKKLKFFFCSGEFVARYTIRQISTKEILAKNKKKN